MSNNGKIYGNWKEIGSYQKKGICKEKAFWKSMYRVGFYLYQQLDISKYLSSYFDNNDFKCLIKKDGKQQFATLVRCQECKISSQSEGILSQKFI